MRPIPSADRARMRRELAELLKRLRAIRKKNLSEDEVAEQVNTALADAGSVRWFVTIPNASDRGSGRCHTYAPRVDKRKLRQAGLSHSRREPARESVNVTASGL